jgi:hypothetical protein
VLAHINHSNAYFKNNIRFDYYPLEALLKFPYKYASSIKYYTSSIIIHGSSTLVRELVECRVREALCHLMAIYSYVRGSTRGSKIRNMKSRTFSFICFLLRNLFCYWIKIRNFYSVYVHIYYTSNQWRHNHFWSAVLSRLLQHPQKHWSWYLTLIFY